MSHWYLINSRIRRGGASQSSFALSIVHPSSPQFAAGAEQELGAPSCGPGSETAVQNPWGQGYGWAGPTTEGSWWWLLMYLHFLLWTLPALTPQAHQHHWDEVQPSTRQWKPVSVGLHQQAAGWQRGWPPVAKDGPACSSLASAPPFSGGTPVPTLRPRPARMFGHGGPPSAPGHGNPREKLLVKLCS